MKRRRHTSHRPTTAEAFRDVVLVREDPMETMLALLARTFIPLQTHGFVTLAQDVRRALERHGWEPARSVNAGESRCE